MTEPEMIETMARAIRRSKFVRTRRMGCYDSSIEPTDDELEECRAALDAIREHVRIDP